MKTLHSLLLAVAATALFAGCCTTAKTCPCSACGGTAKTTACPCASCPAK